MAVQGELSALGAWREIKVLLMQQITEPDIQCSAYTKSIHKRPIVGNLVALYP